jgi:prolyl-tRNA synthetase
MLEAYQRIFARCGLDPLQVEADSGMMGGSASHEFILLHEDGEDTVAICEGCGFAANTEQASFLKLPQSLSPPAMGSESHAPVEVSTPDCHTIEDVARYLGVDTSQTLKAVFFATEDEQPQLIFVVIRGDLEVNETKLSHLVGGAPLRPAQDEEIRAVGAVPGYASPVGLEGVRVVADDSVQMGTDFVAGANREGYHLVGVHYGRDFGADVVADIALVREGDRCPHCGGAWRIRRGIELGHCFKLGTRYTAPAGVTYLDANGQQHAVVLASYGIGVGRLMAAIVEAHHDQYGILWPASVAPYQAHLVSLVREEELAAQAGDLYQALLAAGFEVLYDDRAGLSAGVKFNDADLIGCPLRLTFARRGLDKGGVEAKWRASDEREIVPFEALEVYMSERFGSQMGE